MTTLDTQRDPPTQFQVMTLTGRSTRDPELRELANGGSVCKLRLAVDDMAPGHQTGSINVWPGVPVDGRFEYHESQQDGKTRHDYELIGTVEFLTAPRTTAVEADQPVRAAA